MSLANYDDLVKSITTWSHRKDIGTLIPDFIALAETEMFANDDEVLEDRSIEKTSTATAIGTSPNESRFLALPPGFVDQRDFRITVQEQSLNLVYRTPSAIIVRVGTGTPCRFTVTNEIEFDIIPDQDYTITMKYLAKPTALSTGNQTNEILNSDPNVYLYGALHQVFIWSEDDNEAVKYFNKFQAAIRGANDRTRKGRYGPAPSMKVIGSTP